MVAGEDEDANPGVREFALEEAATETEPRAEPGRPGHSLALRIHAAV
jgi:hypothetical protein